MDGLVGGRPSAWPCAGCNVGLPSKMIDFGSPVTLKMHKQGVGRTRENMPSAATHLTSFVLDTGYDDSGNVQAPGPSRILVLSYEAIV
jgi:hypothetical protein